jgi:hypothetical protein
VPHLTLSARFAELYFPYSTGPLAFASLALGIAAYARPRAVHGELLVASLWGIGAIALSFQLSAPAAELVFLFEAMRVQAWLSGLAGCGMLLATALAYRQGRAVGGIQAAAYICLGIYLWRRCLLGLGMLDFAGDGLTGFLRELQYSQYSLVGSGTAILVSSIWRLSERWRHRPTMRS